MKKGFKFILMSLALLAGLMTSEAFAQNGSNVTVTVQDNVGPLVGAGVLVKGTTNGASTNLDGVATVTAPKNAVLVVSYIGCVTQEVPVNGRSAITVTLEEDAMQLSETVVIGYGTAKRKDYTGSVSSVKLENSPIALAQNTSALESLKGTVSGLDIGATNTAGGAPSMQIRGQKSISGSNDPLLVVDGVIFMGSINDINPNDIASVDVLKDATSAAAYGSRSANGVIMITTKKGRSSKPVITFSASASAQRQSNRPDMCSGDDYIQAVFAKAQSTDLSWMKEQEAVNYKAGNEVDWIDYATRTGVKQDYQVAVSGAGEKINYYLSSSYTDNKGIIIGDDYNRMSVLGKLSTDITSWLKLSVDAAFTRQDYSGVGADYARAFYIDPYGPIYQKGSDEIEKYPMTQSDGLMNPLWPTDERNRKNIDVRDNFRINASAVVKCPWIDGLSYRLNYAANLTKRNNQDFYYERNYVKEGAYDDPSRYSAATMQTLLSKANGTITDYTTFSWVVDNILNYTKTFGKHGVDFTAVATRDSYSYNYNQMNGSDFAANGNTALGIKGLGLATTQKITQDGNKKANIGYMVRGMYSFDDRYFLTASYRRDGASVFGANKKWGDFWAVGGAWKVSNEAFYPSSWKPVLSDLKLKFSYGVNGNQGLSPYGTLSTVSSGAKGGIRYEYTGSNVEYGLVASALGNADLGWESTSAFNYGFESSWLDGRITFDLDAYNSQTRDQIFTRNIPVMTGFKTMKSSLGQVNNWGIEATLRSTIIRTSDWTWTAGLTYWINRNKLASLYGEDLDGDGVEDDDIANGYFIGKSLGVIYGYSQDGIVQKGDPYIEKYGSQAGFPKYEDLNNDGKIDASDRKILGYSNPNFRLNFNTTLSYKNIDLYMLWTGTFGGNDRYLKSNKSAYQINGWGYVTGNVINIPYWTESNPTNVYPSAVFAGDGRFLGLQSRGFVRLQDLTLSYKFNGPWMKKAGIDNLKVYFSGKNLLTFTNWVGDDPETGTGVFTGTYPTYRAYTFGVNLAF